MFVDWKSLDKRACWQTDLQSDLEFSRILLAKVYHIEDAFWNVS